MSRDVGFDVNSETRSKDGRPALRLLAMPVAVGAVTGALLSVIAPYETGAIFSPWQGLLFWTWSSVVAALLLTACSEAVSTIGGENRVPKYIAISVATVVAAVPITLIVYATAPTIDDDIRLLPFWQLFPSVLILCIPLQIVLTLLSGRRVGDVAKVAETAPGLRSPLLDKLPVTLGRDILCMKMEDHYLRVFTAKGDALILMRMGDAEAALGSAGQRVHRSWWVAREAVRSVKTSNNADCLILSNGLEVPVSRSRRQGLRDKGWLH